MNRIYSAHIKFVLIILTIILGYGYFENYEFKNEINLYVKNNYENNNHIFNSLLENEKRVIKIIALALSDNELVRKSFILNSSQNLKDECSNLHKILNLKNLVDEVHFFKPNTESFVNIGNSKPTNTNFIQMRPDVSWVLKHKKSSSHFHTCRMYSGIRTVEPILDKDNNLLGSISVGRSIISFPKLFIQQSSSDFVMFINNTNNLLANQSEHRYLKEFVSDNLEITSFVESKTESINKKLIKHLDFNRNFYLLDFENSKYMINIFYFKDYQGNVNYRMVAIKNLDSIHSKFHNKLFQDLSLIFVLSILIYIFIFKNINTNMKKIRLISKLASKISIQDFKILNDIKIDKDSTNDLDTLTKHIVNMGITVKDSLDKKNQEILENFYIDGLTKLANRRELEIDIKKNEFETLTFLDIDDFSKINDFFGSKVGNSVLIKVAQRLVTFSKNKDLKIYRVGSDEFAILCKHKNLSFLDSFLEEFSNITLKDINQDIEVNIDFTFGISTGVNASISKSDIALHEAKNKKVPYVIYNESLLSKELHEKNIALTKKIRDGLKNDKFTLFYQPIYNRNREIVKYESLVRLKDGDKYLSPYFFLDHSKQSRDYFKISKVVIDKGFDKFRNRDTSFSINLSADDITNPEIAKYVEQKIKDFPKPENVTLELLESEEIEDFQKIIDFLDIVRKYGVKIAIDDFGSGYSNFSYILKIKPDYLKIDGSIIKEIAKKESSYLIAQSIVNMAKATNSEVIGEFIDSEEVFQKGLELGIDMFQGYHLSQPLKDI